MFVVQTGEPESRRRTREVYESLLCQSDLKPTPIIVRVLKERAPNGVVGMASPDLQTSDLSTEGRLSRLSESVSVVKYLQWSSNKRRQKNRGLRRKTHLSRKESVCFCTFYKNPRSSDERTRTKDTRQVCKGD